METLFAHTIGRADLIGGAVRLELVTFQPDPANPAGAAGQVTHAVFMPMEGFLRGMSVLEGLVQQLAQAGVLQRGGPEAAPAAPAPTPAPVAAPQPPRQTAAPAGGPPRSPNFG
jgi:hypothetical protein